MRESNTIVYVNIFWLNYIRWVVINLKHNTTYIHHWGSMCYVLSYIGILVTILDEEEEIWNDAVWFNIKFKFQSLSILLMNKSFIVLVLRVKDFIGWVVETSL